VPGGRSHITSGPPVKHDQVQLDYDAILYQI
jgi:hypothetical protein